MIVVFKPKDRPAKSANQRRARGHILMHLPRRHIALAGVLGLGLCTLLALNPSKPEAQQRLGKPLALNLAAETLAAEPIIDEPEVAPIEWQQQTVKSGDTLSVLFKRVGLNDRDLYEFTKSGSEAKALRNLRPGQVLEFAIEDKQLQQLRIQRDRLTTERFFREAESFTHTTDLREPDVRVAYREARIDTSLFVAASDVGIEDALTMELANIFGWDVDFALDIRRGDSFRVLYEEKFLDGEKLGNGAILAAQFINQGEVFNAVRYVDDEGIANYYTPDGASMRKAFLRAPLDFRRISSNFNPSRLHPVTKRVRPHRGTDYAANTGTPVWAAGDGKVIASGYTKANGNYVVIQHGNEIQTKYLHLHRRYVKRGDRVRQKQKIGTVGSTGLATGPHLHYEFLVNGVHRNPRTIVNKLPKAKSVDPAQLADFNTQIQPWVAKLQQYEQSSRLALLEE